MPSDDELLALFSPFALRPEAPKPIPSMHDVELCVRAAVRQMRCEGQLPEHIIVRLRRVAVNAGVGWNDLLLERIVRWTVNEYFTRA